jgi:Raf kinase inhibitor-like YbhB/YbcL family protein
MRWVLLIFFLGFFACASQNSTQSILIEPFDDTTDGFDAQQESSQNNQYGVNMMKLTSVFEHNADIPSKFTCQGDDINPALIVDEIPEGTQTLALIVDDPDAPSGIWDHWIVWNIPVERDNVIIEEDSIPGVQGTNSFKRLDYGGPCPPSGKHRYFFKVYALSAELDLAEGATKQELEVAMKMYTLQKTELIGLYTKQ